MDGGGTTNQELHGEQRGDSTASGLTHMLLSAFKGNKIMERRIFGVKIVFIYICMCETEFIEAA